MHFLIAFGHRKCFAARQRNQIELRDRLFRGAGVFAQTETRSSVRQETTAER